MYSIAESFGNTTSTQDGLEYDAKKALYTFVKSYIKMILYSHVLELTWEVEVHIA